MTKTRALKLMVPVLLLAAVFGIKWRQDHPPFSATDHVLKKRASVVSEADLALRKAARVADMLIIAPSDNAWVMETGLASLHSLEVSDRKMIRQAVSLLGCFGSFTESAQVPRSSSGQSLRMYLTNIPKKLEDPDHFESLMLINSRGRYYLVRNHLASALRGATKGKAAQQVATVNPQTLPRFFHGVRALVAKAHQHKSDSHVFIEISGP